MTADLARPFARLPAPERALLWCMRAWVVGHCENRSVSGHIDAVLGRFGDAAGTGDLHDFMLLLGRGARRTIGINCICYEEVSEDERTLLDAFALEQLRDHRAAGAAMADLVVGWAVPPVCEHAGRLALAFAAAGSLLTVPARDSLAWTGIAALGGTAPHPSP